MVSSSKLLYRVNTVSCDHSLNKQQVNQVFKEFAMQEISPITVEDVGEKPLPGLGVLLKEIYE